MKKKEDIEYIEVRSRIWILFTTLIIGILLLLYLIFAFTLFILIHEGILHINNPFTFTPLFYLIAISSVLGINYQLNHNLREQNK